MRRGRSGRRSVRQRLRLLQKSWECRKLETEMIRPMCIFANEGQLLQKNNDFQGVEVEVEAKLRNP